MNKNQKYKKCQSIAGSVGFVFCKTPTSLGLRYSLVDRKKHKCLQSWYDINKSYEEIKESIKKFKG